MGARIVATIASLLGCGAAGGRVHRLGPGDLRVELLRENIRPSLPAAGGHALLEQARLESQVEANSL